MTVSHFQHEANVAQTAPVPQFLSPLGCSYLERIFNTPIFIGTTGPGPMVTLQLIPRMFLSTLFRQLQGLQVHPRAVHLEGSAAAACLIPEQRKNDLDFVFYLEGEDSTVLHVMREALVRSITESLDPALVATTPDIAGLVQQFISKLFLKDEPGPQGDLWALCSLQGCGGSPGLDIKSIVRCRRMYQFSVDSVYADVLAFALGAPSLIQPVLIGTHYGSIGEVREHLQHRLIAMHTSEDPANVFGGGLLKYANLVAQGYRLAPHMDVFVLEHTMCARFCTDFPPNEVSRFSKMLTQVHAVNNFLRTHFPPDTISSAGLLFMSTLHTILLRACPHDRCHKLVDVLEKGFSQPGLYS